jgi:hypothetical protein
VSTKLTLSLSDSTNRAMEILSERLDIQRGDAVTELANSTLDALADGPPIPALGDEAPGPGEATGDV